MILLKLYISFRCLELPLFLISARDIKVVRPLYGVELFDGETARFEVEISEDDVHGQWKLKDEVLAASPVSNFSSVNPICHNVCLHILT